MGDILQISDWRQRVRPIAEPTLELRFVAVPWVWGFIIWPTLTVVWRRA